MRGRMRGRKFCSLELAREGTTKGGGCGVSDVPLRLLHCTYLSVMRVLVGLMLLLKQWAF